MNLGFVGLGIMGRPMALHLLAAGHAVACFSRRAASMQPVVAAGATACASPADVARQADIVFTMVPDTPDVEQVILGVDGIAQTARTGSVVVDMSTIAPLATRTIATALAARGIDLLDAPCSGGEAGAIAAKLSIMVGGRRDVFDRVRPLFEHLGTTITYIGDSGAGQVAKACNQIVGAVTMEAVAEGLNLARRNGVDPARVRAAMLGGFARSRMLELAGARMIGRDFAPGFRAKLHAKDLDIAMRTAYQLGLALPQAALVAQHLNALVGGGGGELDSSAIITVLERMAGDQVDPP